MGAVSGQVGGVSLWDPHGYGCTVLVEHEHFAEPRSCRSISKPLVDRSVIVQNLGLLIIYSCWCCTASTRLLLGHYCFNQAPAIRAFVILAKGLLMLLDWVCSCFGFTSFIHCSIQINVQLNNLCNPTGDLCWLEFPHLIQNTRNKVMPLPILSHVVQSLGNNQSVIICDHITWNHQTIDDSCCVWLFLAKARNMGMAPDYHFPKMGCSVWFFNVLRSNMMNLIVRIPWVPLLWAVRIFPPWTHLFYQPILKLGYVWYPCQGSENVYPPVCAKLSFITPLGNVWVWWVRRYWENKVLCMELAVGELNRKLFKLGGLHMLTCCRCTRSGWLGLNMIWYESLIQSPELKIIMSFAIPRVACVKQIERWTRQGHCLWPQLFSPLRYCFHICETWGSDLNFTAFANQVSWCQLRSLHPHNVRVVSARSLWIGSVSCL